MRDGGMGLGRRHAIRIEDRLRTVRGREERDQAALHDRSHVQHGGDYRVEFRLKQKDKIVGRGSTDVKIRPGVRDPGGFDRGTVVY